MKQELKSSSYGCVELEKETERENRDHVCDCENPVGVGPVGGLHPR